METLKSRPGGAPGVENASIMPSWSARRGSPEFHEGDQSRAALARDTLFLGEFIRSMGELLPEVVQDEILRRLSQIRGMLFDGDAKRAAEVLRQLVEGLLEWSRRNLKGLALQLAVRCLRGSQRPEVLS
jgi:hypothetical protein